MKHLRAPWRADYVESASEPQDGCFLCRYWNEPTADAEHRVVRRWQCWYAVLNAYPYTNGHLMLVLGRHHEGFAGLRGEESAELGSGLEACESVLREVYRPHGLNIGVNMGRAAGAGAVGHLHVHLVPRWEGDTNFMTAAADTRVLPESLESSWERLRAAFDGRAS